MRAAVALGALATAAAAGEAAGRRYNVLFIVSDDMRPSIGPYGLPEAVTPNLDRLASGGVTFMRAHVQFSYCAPSRNSFMSGRRPDATKVYNFIDHFREKGVGDQWVALPEHFKNSGYLVTGVGKLYHPGVPPNFDQPRSWSDTGPDGEKWPYLDSGKVNGTNLCKEKCCGAPARQWCLFDVKPDTYLLDQSVRNEVVGRLGAAITNWKQTKQPFFVGMGTHRPHLPWQFPKEFLAKIPAAVAEAKHQAWSADVPHLAFHQCKEMSVNYYDTDGLGTPPQMQGQYFAANQAEARRAYYGCISYTDSLIGDALDALASGGAENDTVVSFMGDHGWHLGEHDMWCKMSNLELGTRVPLIIRAPWMRSKGVRSGALAEAVDLYPTLCELAGVPLPTGPGAAYLGGTSLAPIFEDPSAVVKNASLSQFPRCWENNTNTDPAGHEPGDENNRTSSWETMSDCHWVKRDGIDFMGYKMRTSDWSVTLWVRWNATALRPDWDRVVGQELYSHAGDDGTVPSAFDDYENTNLAADPAHAQRLSALSAQLRVEVERWISPNP